MAVYDINGNALSQVYGIDGSPLLKAYAVDGTEIFPDEPPQPTQLRVMTYNVGQWYIGSGDNVPSNLDSAFYALQNGIIQRNDPDILFIEEYSKQFSKTGRTALSILQQYFPYIHEQDGTGSYGYYLNRCICSKHPIGSYVVRTYSNDVNRYYDSCVVTVDGVQITLVVTHFDAFDSSKRIVQATELFNFVKTINGGFIIGGDFNNSLKDPFSEENAAIYNQFLNYGCNIANAGNFGIFKTACGNTDWENSSSAIDNIICSSGITITDVWTDLTKITNADVLAAGKIDHIPLIAEMEL